MWPFKSKIDQLFEIFLSPDAQKSLAAKAEILELVGKDAPPDRLLGIKSPLAAEVFLRFIEKHYEGLRIEPMIEYLLSNNHKEDLIERLAQNRIQPDLGEPTVLQNRAILIGYLTKHCAETGDHSLALSLRY